MGNRLKASIIFSSIKMLPILPALLLLILQGPSSIEKMALEGRLPAALEAASRRMEAQEHRFGSTEKADAAVLASLLALSGDPDLSHALYQLLSLDQGTSLWTTVDSPESGDWVDRKPLKVGSHPSLPEPFLESQRSRDGPL